MPRDENNLTPKQALFVKEYLVDFNASRAARVAGYSEKTAGTIGAENLEKPQIRAIIDAEREKRNARIEITQDYVLRGIKEVAERCMEKVPVLDSEGNNIGTWTFHPAAANKSYELLGKHIGMFTEKREISGKLEHKVESDVTIAASPIVAEFFESLKK